MPLTKLERHALAIFKAALAAVEPKAATARSLKKLKLPLENFDRVFLVAAGKAAAGMAMAAEKFLGNRLTAGIALTKYGHATDGLRRTKILEAAHPVPDAAGFEASQEIEQLLRSLNSRDLLLTAISGGASALLSAPAPGVSLRDKQRATDLLLRAGADIFELNVVRKHLSRLKGGQMAALAYPATVVNLVLSDVIGDPIDVIGSGPTAPDTSTFQDACDVLTKYGLMQRVPASVRSRLLAGVGETPKPSDPIFANVRNIVTASNRQALAAAAARAQLLGYKPLILSSVMQGEAREVARAHAAILRDAAPGSCILSGGETTVTVKGKGKGGRNQEFALALALDIDGVANVAALCAGTDGTDGPTDAAGAFVTGRTIGKARQAGLNAREFLGENNAYEFFRGVGGLLVTGPTGTNVMDISVMLTGLNLY
jgi:hydroxypyruvate reductase